MAVPPAAPTNVRDLKVLIQSRYPVIAIETVEEGRVTSILEAVGKRLGVRVFTWSIAQGLVGVPGGDATQDTGPPLKLMLHLDVLCGAAIYHLRDFAPHLNDAEAARRFRELAQRFIDLRATAVITGPTIKLPPEVEHLAVRYELALPQREELRALLVATLRELPSSEHAQVALERTDVEDYLRALSGLTLGQARQVITLCLLEDGRLDAADIQRVLDRKAQVVRDGGILEYYPTAGNRYELGGFKNLKAWLKRAALGFGDEARRLHLAAPRGILIVGVQGCGKSLAAKAVAREWRLPLLKLDAGRLFDKYIGESERNFRKAISLAEAMAPVVLWIDEIEKGLNVQGGEAEGGLSRRLFGAFLTWLQEKRKEVFVVATANDLSTLPPELLRKGRFDEVFFVDLPEPDEREAIFRIQIALRGVDPGRFDTAGLARAAAGFSGAEIEQAVIGAAYRALERKQPLADALILEEIAATIPLSVARREDVGALREMAKGRFVPVR